MVLPDFLVQDPDDFLRIAGHRIGLNDIVHFYNEGYSAEMMLEQFPALPLPVVHKVFAFYLENRGEVDAYCARMSDEAVRRAPRCARPLVSDCSKATEGENAAGESDYSMVARGGMEVARVPPLHADRSYVWTEMMLCGSVG